MDGRSPSSIMRLLRNVELSTLSNINLQPFFVIALYLSITLFLVGFKELIFAISSSEREVPSILKLKFVALLAFNSVESPPS